jgi:GGDEF domain-containing protein
MVAELCASARSLDPDPDRHGAKTGTCAHEREPNDAPVIDWRGFHTELRGAAVAATQTGAPLSLLMLELAGLTRIAGQASANVVAERLGALADLIRRAVGGQGALAHYAEERLAVIMKETDLCAAIAGAERIGQSLASPGGDTGEVALRVPAIGIAQFHDDESLGDLIQRAADALGRAKAERSLVAVAGRGAHRSTDRALCRADPAICSGELCGG